MNLSADATKWIQTAEKPLRPSSPGGHSNGEQSDSSVELILCTNDDGRRKDSKHSSRSSNKHFQNYQYSTTNCVKGGHNEFVNCIVIEPRKEGDICGSDLSMANDFTESNSDENTGSAFVSGIGSAYVNGIAAYGGNYTCEGHSVQSVIDSFQVDMTASNLPLDLSKPSKRHEEPSETLDLSATHRQNINSIENDNRLKSNSNDSNSEQKLIKVNNVNHKVQKQNTAASKRRSSSAEKSPDLTDKSPAQNAAKRNRTGSRSKREEPSQCSFCSKWFCSSWSRISHERTHTGQNRFYCKVCHRSFPTQHNHTKNKDAQSNSAPDINDAITTVSASAPNTTLGATALNTTVSTNAPIKSHTKATVSQATADAKVSL